MLAKKSKNNVSIKGQQKKAKEYTSNKVSITDTDIEIKGNEYHYKYIVRTDGTYTICRMSHGLKWEQITLEVDYKQLRAWQENKTDKVKNKDTDKFSGKYANIDFII